MKLLKSLTVLCFLSACVAMTPPQPITRMAFPMDEYLALPKSGNAIVRGQAFLKTRGGDVKFAAGNVVVLNPVTSYSLEWYEKSYIPSKPMVPFDDRLLNFMPQQIADGNGRFTFKNVPPGDYFVTTKVTWEAPTGYQGALQLQGGLVTKRITVHDGDELEIIVTR